MANQDDPQAVINSANAANAKYNAIEYGSQLTLAPHIGGDAQYHATLVQKHDAKAGDPAWGPVGARQQVMQTELKQETGTCVRADATPVDPAISGQTMQNARLLPSSVQRSTAEEFYQGGMFV